MRVGVLYATDFASISPGGIQNFLWRVGRYAPDDLDITYLGLGKAERLPRPSDKFRSLGEVGAEKVNRTFLRGLWSIRPSLAAEYDVLVAHRVEHVPVLPARLPLLLMLHGGTWNAIRAANRSFGILYPAVEALACWRADRVLSVDADAHTWLARKLGRRIRPIATPASETFRSAQLAPRRDILLTAARLVPEKRIDRLIRLAAASHRRLVIFGDGPSRPKLEQLAADLGADVDFRGAVDSDGLAAEYRKGGVFCLGSAFEGYPLAAVEAATSGLPLLGVESTALRQLEGLGAVSTSSLAEALTVIENGSAGGIEPRRAWEMHSPECVSSVYWDHVRRLG